MPFSLGRGDIIKVHFSPQKGFEQSGWRPAMVLSPLAYNQLSNFVLLCPISNTENQWFYFVDIPNNKNVKTTGKIITDQIKSFDLSARRFQHVETLPDEVIIDVLSKVTTLFEH
ncbi:type II toxin-antitoxin system PemK/MazF family toxin [Aureibacillus halotolerans]|uniref:mRNA interferase MazF n=1 Tax=Aureibacillus halotolerans TaxID=1508390 RepID=A0A4R6U915_9BACI|nr:type II toxin-antitoxin system PemK/MazF family toxin [Aureibacillus halotolerans]TDQ42911.1 mRNA interferase MazF [Aureibacillus halotolerans]